MRCAAHRFPRLPPADLIAFLRRSPSVAPLHFPLFCATMFKTSQFSIAVGAYVCTSPRPRVPEVGRARPCSRSQSPKMQRLFEQHFWGPGPPGGTVVTVIDSTCWHVQLHVLIATATRWIAQSSATQWDLPTPLAAKKDLNVLLFVYTGQFFVFKWMSIACRGLFFPTWKNVSIFSPCPHLGKFSVIKIGGAMSEWVLRRGVCFSDDVVAMPTCRYKDGGRQAGLAAPLSSDADGVQHARRQAPQRVRLGASRDFLLSPVAVRRHVDDSENV